MSSPSVHAAWRAVSHRLYYLGVRFVNGMGFVTNLNGGYAWGLWVVYDIVIGTALACGGYALAVVVYVANKGKYHPLMRPALLASLLGYGLGGVGALSIWAAIGSSTIFCCPGT